jgi:molybdopterin converting factor subunit 1
VKILLFAAARQRVGANSIELNIDVPTTVTALRRKIAEQYPDLAVLLVSSRIAANQKFMDEEATLDGGEEIAIIPPVSGG